MAIRYERVYIDDLDGTTLEPGEAETIEFGFDGKAYTIDLTETNAAAFRDAMAKYIKVAQRVTPTTRRAAKAKRGTAELSGSGQMAKIRRWAREKGYSVSSRGRIHAEVVEAYNAAH